MGFASAGGGPDLRHGVSPFRLDVKPSGTNTKSPYRKDRIWANVYRGERTQRYLNIPIRSNGWGHFFISVGPTQKAHGVRRLWALLFFGCLAVD